MARMQVPFYTLNAGEIDNVTVNRIDLEKMRMAGDTMINWFPSTRGPMSMRPGTKYVYNSKDYADGVLLPFIYNASNTSLLEITEETIRVYNDDELVTYPSHGTTIVNGTFDDFTGWVNDSDLGGKAYAAAGKLVLDSTTYSYGRAYQQVAIAAEDQGVLHCLKIDIQFGPITLRIGSTPSGRQVLEGQRLDTGVHFISFYPTSDEIYIQFEANDTAQSKRKIRYCNFYKDQTLNLPVPWKLNHLGKLRYAQSGSIIFVACKGYRPYKIERRGANSWSIVEYETSAGPYLPYSTDKIRLKPSASVGDISLISDKAFFRQGMEGALFEITYDREMQQELLTAKEHATQPVKVTGVGATDRTFNIKLEYDVGSSGTVVLERAFGAPDAWKKAEVEVSGTEGPAATSFTGSVDVTFADVDRTNEDRNEIGNLDNQVVYYRLRATTDIVGSVYATIISRSGTAQVGIVRVKAFIDNKEVRADVIKPLGANNRWTDDWREGAWSDAQSWPSSVTFHDGRIWWAGEDKVYGSVSDDYYNFDPNKEGDAAPVVRSIALGPVEGIHWMLSTQRLLVGTAMSAVSIRSSSIDEPITPTKFTAKTASTVGCGSIQAIGVDSGGVFVQRNGTKVYEIFYDAQVNDYAAGELTRLNQEICAPKIVQLAIQRQPDTRIYCVKSDGTMAVLLYDRAEGVVGWSRYETDGEVQSVCVLPTGRDDDVYIMVRRLVNGEKKCFIEKFASNQEISGGNAIFLMDAIKEWSSASPTTTITGMEHLAGQEVLIISTAGAFPVDSYDDASFATGASLYVETKVVSSTGTISASIPLTAAYVGLAYTARFQSVKLAYAAQAGSALTMKKRVNHLAIVGINTATDGLKIGSSFDKLMSLSKVYKGRELQPFEVLETWDYDASSFPGKWDSDSRFCIQNVSPYPATISGVVVSLETNDRS